MQPPGSPDVRSVLAAQWALTGLATGVLGIVGFGATRGASFELAPRVCLFRRATGVPCPLCGTTRSLAALGRGDLIRSVEFNPAGPVLALAAPPFIATSVPSLFAGAPLHFPPRLGHAALAALAALWLLRLAVPRLRQRTAA